AVPAPGPSGHVPVSDTVTEVRRRARTAAAVAAWRVRRRCQTPSRRCGVSVPELVRVAVDGHEVQVPKGTGLVETALAAGIEIPVFCYEPRLGPPVGAC